LRKLLIGQPEVGIGMELFCWFWLLCVGFAK